MRSLAWMAAALLTLNACVDFDHSRNDEAWACKAPSEADDSTESRRIGPLDTPGPARPARDLGRPADQRLDEGWQLASSEEVGDNGRALSRPGAARASGDPWIEAQVPGTVLGQISQNKAGTETWSEVNVGRNWLDIDGAEVSFGEHESALANRDLPDSSPFAVPWWLRHELDIPELSPDTRVFLDIEGLNYRGQLWVNGRKLADEDQLIGTFIAHRIDVTRALEPGGENLMAIRVEAAPAKALAHTFVDWMPEGPDKAMGLWRPVTLRFESAVEIVDAIVHSKVQTDHSQADLTVDVELKNHDDRDHEVKLKLRLGLGLDLEHKVTVEAGSEKIVELTPKDHTELSLDDPPLWWPYGWGRPRLHELELEIEDSKGKLLDRSRDRFGIREVGSRLDEGGHRRFSINHREIFIRGAGWAPDLLYRRDRQRITREMHMVRDLGLNTVRLEGKFGSDHLLNLADELGILLMPGWCCCDHWEHWDQWSERDHAIARASMLSQARRLRRHPSMLAWFHASDKPAPAVVEDSYTEAMTEARFRVPMLSSASETSSPASGPSGVKMEGPYEWVPPMYWYEGRGRLGGAGGFATEIGIGPSIPMPETLAGFIPKGDLWPRDNKVWNFHAARGQFSNLDYFDSALEERLGTPEDLEDYTYKANFLNYRGQRAMYEAYRRHAGEATGLIGWMLNDGWPSVYWHIFAHDLSTAGAYHGAKVANRPVHVLHDPFERRVVVVNADAKAHSNLQLSISVFSSDGRRRYQQQAEVDVAACGRREIDTSERPQPGELGDVEILALVLRDRDGLELSHNVYWLPTTGDRLAWAESTWYHTPVRGHADLREAFGRDRVDRLKLKAKVVDDPDDLPMRFAAEDNEVIVRVDVPNPSDIVVMAQLRLLDRPGGKELRPSLWSDNFMTLVPGSARSFAVRVEKELWQAASAPTVAIRGANLRGSEVEIDLP